MTQRPSRLLAAALLGLLIGAGLGLLAGRVVWPLRYATVTTAWLDAAYREDTVRMVAAVYDADGDTSAAAAWLTRLGPGVAADLEAAARDATPEETGRLARLAAVFSAPALPSSTPGE